MSYPALIAYLRAGLRLMDAAPMSEEDFVKFLEDCAASNGFSQGEGKILRECSPEEATILHLDVSLSKACFEAGKLLAAGEVPDTSAAQHRIAKMFFAGRLFSMSGLAFAHVLTKVELDLVHAGVGFDPDKEQCFPFIRNNALCLALVRRTVPLSFGGKPFPFDLHRWQPGEGKPN